MPTETATVFVYEQGHEEGVQVTEVPYCLTCRTGLGAYAGKPNSNRAIERHVARVHPTFVAARQDGTIQDLDAILNPPLDETPAQAKKRVARVRKATKVTKLGTPKAEAKK